jgi:hypothetical protein
VESLLWERRRHHMRDLILSSPSTDPTGRLVPVKARRHANRRSFGRY